MGPIVRKRRKPVAEINVVPYIDVMLVLLIIFMVTAPIITQGVKVDLPQASAKALDKDSQTPLIASVDADGNYYLDVGDNKNEVLTAGQLAVMVKAQLTVNPKTPVIVKGDRNVSYDQVIQLMVTLQKAGAPTVGLMTDSKDK
ncbi:protein TolR [Algicola sagamiensis]|uniref:protein TolR n=1 Tax=Algicola sagamiensis TaxID=163869 RepID=UPI000372BFA9|nr:protein TolR [Algicola sagamiensis]